MNSVKRMCPGCHRGDCPDCTLRRSELKAWGRLRRRVITVVIGATLYVVLARFGFLWAAGVFGLCLLSREIPADKWRAVLRTLGGDDDANPPGDEE